MDENTETEDNGFDAVKRDRIAKARTFLADHGYRVSETLAGAVYDGLERLAGNRKLWFEPESPTRLHRTLRLQLLFTLLVPGGKASKAAVAASALDRLFLRKNRAVFALLRSRSIPRELKIKEVIRRLDSIVDDVMYKNVRFPRTKLDRVGFANNVLPSMLPELIRKLMDGPTEILHKALVDNVPGFGPKAAAHFMRNTGLQTMDTGFVPIVDTHIRRFMGIVGIAGSQKACGKEFAHLCQSLDVNPLLADALVWCVASGTEDPGSVDFGNWQ